MDGCITNVDWNQLNDTNLREKLQQKIREVFIRDEDKVFLRRFESSVQNFTQKFKKCITEEDAKYRFKKTKHTRRIVSTAAEVPVSATVPKRPRTSLPALQEPIPPATHISLTQSSLEQQVSELRQDSETLVAWQNLGEPDVGVFSYWSETALKILDTARQIQLAITECVFKWDKRKRRLANQFEHNDERFDVKGDQFDYAAFDRVRVLYVEEVNNVENQAQTTVNCLYGLIDSAAWLRSYYQKHQAVHAHLQMQAQAQEVVSNVEQKARQQIIELAKATFIVWRQSEQVIKAGNKFKATVRLLVGPALRLGVGPEPTVTVAMLTADVLKAGGRTNVVSGRQFRVQVTSNPETVPLQAVLRPTEYDVTVMRTGPAGRKDVRTMPRVGVSQQQSLWAEFADITWKNEDKRTANKDELTVCELKYGAEFKTTLNLFGEMVTLRCWSLPLILIVHASQECKAHGTIFWDNAFSEKRREPFAAPEEVSWHKFSTKFNRWFAWQTRAPGNTLALHNTQFVQCCMVEPGTDKVTLSRFYRERLNGPIKLNFLEWVFDVMKLISEDAFLQFLWQRGAVYGFTTHETGLHLLQKNESDFGVKAMLLRFSTTPIFKKKGPGHVGLVVMTYARDACDQYSIRSLMPATAEDLRGIANLRKRMLSAKVTHEYLYPNWKWKDTLLQEFDAKQDLDQSESDSASKHYVKVDFDIVFPEEFPTDPIGAFTDADTGQYPTAVSEPDLTRELANDLAEHLAISNSSSSFAPFINIQQYSGQTDLDNIDAFMPPDI